MHWPPRPWSQGLVQWSLASLPLLCCAVTVPSNQRTFERPERSNMAALDDAASVFELYLDAAEGSDPRASGGVVLVDA